MKRKSKQLSRKQKGSKNREKAKQRLAKLHYKISNIRKDALHKATSAIVNENQVIVIEDLAVGNMIKNRKLSRAISDVGMFEFRRQIEYKVKWRNKTLVIADRFYPSSKMDWKSKKVNKDLTLSDRVIRHDDGTITDRDLNAAINLEHYFYTLSSREIYDCGDRSSENVNSLSLSEKQESNRKSSFRFL